jgi:flagellar transcriptional activator FlhD
MQEDILSEIRDSNLNYLMLAQQMIKADKVSAIFRMSISHEIADVLEGLSNSQLIKLANSNQMLTRFRFEDKSILNMLTSHDKDYGQASAHRSILMSGQSVEAIS